MGMNLEKDIVQLGAVFEKKLIEIRRYLHQNPELGYEEHLTSALIIRELEQLEGIEIIKGLGKGTGVLGVLRGSKPGKTILLRADMDALPIEEKTDLAYSSLIKGCMHACGHDVHITWLLGAAMILSQLRTHIKGTVKFLFQPAEEVGGSCHLIEDPRVLHHPEVESVFAAHAWPSMEVGTVGIAEKYAFGAVKNFKIEILGKGGHGSWPNKAIDPIAVANVVYTAIQQIISRQINPIEPRVLSIGSIHAGPLDKGNIIPDVCTMIGTIRATKSDVIQEMERSIKALSEHISQGFNASCRVEFNHGLSPVVNDANLIQDVFHSFSKILGEKNVYLIKEPNLGGEDFSLFTEKKPGVYFFVGASSKENIEKNTLHSPTLVLDEKVIIQGATLFAMLSLDLK